MGRKVRRILSAVFQVMNHVEKLINRAVLAAGTMLIHDGVYRHAGLDARKDMARLAKGQRFDNGERAMLAVLRIFPPPDHSEYLTRPEVVNGAPIPLLVVIHRITKAQAINQ